MSLRSLAALRAEAENHGLREVNLAELPADVRQSLQIGVQPSAEAPPISLFTGFVPPSGADTLITLIPAEAVALYVAAIGAAASSASETLRWAVLAAVGVFTPVLVMVTYWERKGGGRQAGFPLLEMLVGTLAFVAWSTAVPEGPWDAIGLATWVGTLIVAFSSAVLYLVVRLAASWTNGSRKPAGTLEPAEEE